MYPPPCIIVDPFLFRRSLGEWIALPFKGIRWIIIERSKSLQFVTLKVNGIELTKSKRKRERFCFRWREKRYPNFLSHLENRDLVHDRELQQRGEGRGRESTMGGRELKPRFSDKASGRGCHRLGKDLPRLDPFSPGKADNKRFSHSCVFDPDFPLSRACIAGTRCAPTFVPSSESLKVWTGSRVAAPEKRVNERCRLSLFRSSNFFLELEGCGWTAPTEQHPSFVRKKESVEIVTWMIYSLEMITINDN